MRCFNGATAASTSEAVKRGVMYWGQFKSKTITSMRNRRSTRLLARGEEVGLLRSERVTVWRGRAGARPAVVVGLRGTD